MSTITDLENRRIINLNHKKKEYSVITFEEMMEMFENAAAYGQSQAEQAKEDMESSEEMAQYDVDFDLRVENTGKTKKIDGNKAEQTVMIIETIFEPKEGANDSLPSTKMYAINDTWMSDDVPEMKVAEQFHKDMAEAMEQEFTEMNIATILSSLLKSDPRVGSAMEKAKEEMMKMDGFPLASTMHIVTVPPGKELDLELALGEKEEEKSGGGFGGFGGLLKQAAKSQGVDMGDDEEGGEPAEAKQATLVSFESRTEDISDKSRDLDYYQIPTEYTEVEYERPEIPQAGG